MKTALLCLSLCSLAWAQSEFQPHYKKAKQKCVGEHQIMVKGRHSKHGFYIFNYVYSSLVPNNQTQIQKEDNKTISSATDGADKKHKPRKPSDNLTDASQETSSRQKHLTGRRDDGKPEDRTSPGRKQDVKEHHGNIRNWDFQQPQLELTVGKENDFAGGDAANEIDGSGDIDFPGEVASHHVIAISHEDSDQGKDHQITRDSESGNMDGKSKDGKPTTTNPSKNGTMKIWVKENEASVTQENKKIKGPQSKDYSELSWKSKTNSTTKEPSREAGNDLGLSNKQGNLTVRLHSPFRVQSNVSEDLGGIVHVVDKSNFTSTLDIGEIKIANGKGNLNVTVHRKGENEPIVIVSKWKAQSGVTEPHQKSEARGDSGSHVEVAGTITSHKRYNEREGVITGMSSSKTEESDFSKTRKKDKGETYVGGKLISQVEDPIFTKPDKRKQTEATKTSKIHTKEKGEMHTIEKFVTPVKDLVFTKPNEKTNHSGTTGSRKFKDYMGGVTESYSKAESVSYKTFSGSQPSTSSTIMQGRKDAGEDGIPRRKSNAGQKDVGLIKSHPKKVGRHEKISTKPHESLSGDAVTNGKEKNRFGITFQEVSEDTIKESISYGHATGDITNLKRSDNIESSDQKEEQERQHSVQLNGVLSLSPGSHNNVQHLFNMPDNGNNKNQEHSLPSVKVVEKVIKQSRGTAKAHVGTSVDKIAKRPQKHSGVLRRKSSPHAKRHPSHKKAHGSDSSPSSESKEERWNDSQQSYEDYQNDQVGSHPSAESTEDLSPESHQSDNHSNMED